MKMDDMICAVQKKLRLTADGQAGPKTWATLYSSVVDPKKTPAALMQSIDAVDARSEKVIATLENQVQPYARALVQKALAAGINIKIISGLRTYQEQDAIYAQGRTTPGNIVTKVKAGYSAHNFGIAFDVGLFAGSRYLGESPLYKAVGLLGRGLGLEWGGDWKTFEDQPHFELRPLWSKDMTESQMMTELRRRHDAGTPIFG
jgi:peptidoglycan L-alanyl-D-glutamate endopeptidase CwlK